MAILRNRDSTGKLVTRNGTYNRPADTRPPPPPPKKRTQAKARPAADNGPRTPAEQPPPGIAAAKVFHVYELVEMILLKLGTDSIKHAMRASDYITSVAEQSKPLLHHIAGPTPPGLEVIWKVHDRTSIEVIPGPMTIYMALAPWPPEPFPLDTPFYITPLISNEKLLQPAPWIDNYTINPSNGELVKPPQSEKATPRQSAFVRLELAAYGSWTWSPKLPGISSLGEECLDMFFTNPPATSLEVGIKVPRRMYQADVGQTVPGRRSLGKRVLWGPKSRDFRIVREGGVRLSDVVAVVEKADSEWITQLRSGGCTVKFEGERVVLVTQEIFDFVKEQGTVRLLDEETVSEDK